MVKNPTASAGDAGSIPGLERSPGGGNSNPLQYSCLENSITEDSGRLQSLYLFLLIAQSSPTFCSPMDDSLPGSSVHGILQARILEWVAIFSSRGSSLPRDQTQVWWIAGRFYHLSHHQWSRATVHGVRNIWARMHVRTHVENKRFRSSQPFWSWG